MRPVFLAARLLFCDATRLCLPDLFFALDPLCFSLARGLRFIGTATLRRQCLRMSTLCGVALCLRAGLRVTLRSVSGLAFSTSNALGLSFLGSGPALLSPALFLYPLPLCFLSRRILGSLSVALGGFGTKALQLGTIGFLT